MIPVATVVLPTPLWVPATTMRGTLIGRPSCCGAGFQIERKPGDREDHLIRGLGGPLIQEP
jgi:hypothetical protein